MRTTAAADWRRELPFERAVRLDEVVPGDEARCAACGPEAAPRPRGELWAFKHRHPKNHDGFVRIYCDVHVPRPAPPAPLRTQVRSTRQSAPRRSAAEQPKAICPECFVEVPATGVCGVCGTAVKA